MKLETLSKVKDLISDESVMVGAPVAGGGFGLGLTLMEISAIVSMLVAISGLIMGIVSFCLKRKINLEQLRKLQKENEQISDTDLY